MGFTLTMRETKQVLNQKDVIINGRVCKDPHLGIGLFDVVAVPKIGKQYLILRDNRGRIVSKEITPDQAKVRLCKVTNKTIIRNGQVQLNLRYGANLIADNSFKPNDSIVITLGDVNDSSSERLTIVDHYPFAIGSYAMIIGGKHRGKVGKIVAINKRPGNVPNSVVLEEERERIQFDSIEKYVYVIGRSSETAEQWRAGE
jgi:small subunit ribosomal protein S4e